MTSAGKTDSSTAGAGPFDEGHTAPAASAVVTLLRALATGSLHKANKHDVIFTAAADQLEAASVMLAALEGLSARGASAESRGSFIMGRDDLATINAAIAQAKSAGIAA